MELICYVYAVTRAGIEAHYPEYGIIRGHKIFSVETGGLCALVSHVPCEKFSRETLEKNMGDIGWLEQMVRAHTGIVKAIVSEGGVVPMRFCTVSRDPQAVHDFLESNKKSLIEKLEQVKGAQEWGVKVFCNKNKLGNSLLVSAKEASKPGSEKNASAGTSFLLKKKRQLEHKKNVTEVSVRCKKDCHNRLGLHAVSSLITALQDKEMTGRSEEMIFNGAYLVNKGKTKDFQSTIVRLARQYSDLGFEIVQSGPWPPYHFIEDLS